MKEARLINRFSEKNSHLGEWAILGPKIAHPHNSGSAGRIFFKIWAMKEGKRKMRVILKIFKKKKKNWGKWTVLGPKMVYPHNSGSAVRMFLNFAQ